MTSKVLIRIAAVVSMCLAATAFAGLPWADARSHPPGAKAAAGNKVCLKYDSDDPKPMCLGRGQQGQRGLRGPTGAAGARGATGPVGFIGPIGAIGAQGPTGARGVQGIQGIQGVRGPDGAFGPDGTHPTGHTEVVLGTKPPPVFILNGPSTGTELPPSVARCPISGPDQEAYDGGAIITTSSNNDVVGLEDSYPGLYVDQATVDPLPLGSKPGAVSTLPANAYEARAVIGEMQSNDSVSVQAYVVCGP